MNGMYKSVPKGTTFIRTAEPFTRERLSFAIRERNGIGAPPNLPAVLPPKGDLSPVPRMIPFREKIQAEEAKTIYRQRAEVAEFPNAWIKAKLGLRQFHLRGRVKAGMEAL